MSGVTAIATTPLQTCALLGSGSIDCWGQGAFGVLGNGTTNDQHTPKAVSGITHAKSLSCGLGNCCALIDDGSVQCWGSGSTGVLGGGADSSTPVTIKGVPSATAISVGNGAACALLGDGTVSCWGADGGPLGRGYSAVPSSTPQLVLH